MYNIKILSIVDENLLNIFDYILENTYDIWISENIINHIYWAIYSLNFLPYRYQVVFENIRVINVKWYKIFYEIDENKKTIIIYRILWWRQYFCSNFIKRD